MLSVSSKFTLFNSIIGTVYRYIVAQSKLKKAVSTSFTSMYFRYRVLEYSFRVSIYYVSESNNNVLTVPRRSRSIDNAH